MLFRSQQALIQTPEIESSDLSSLILELSTWGVSNPLDLQWLTPPPNANIQQARSLLCQLEFIDKQGQLTTFGEQSRQLGLEPRLAAIALQAQKHSIEHLHTALYLLPLIEEPAKAISSKDLSFHLSLLLAGKYPKQAYYLQRVQRLAKLLSIKENIQIGRASCRERVSSPV